MFTPQKLEEIPIELQKIFSKLEQEIMIDIVRRVAQNGQVTRTADYQINRLHELGVSKRVIKKYIREALKLSKKEINHIYKDVIRQGYAEDESLYKATGKPFVRFENNEDLQQMIRAIKSQTENKLYNLSNSTGFIKNDNGKNVFTPLTQYYQDVLDKNVSGILNGVIDYNTAIKNVVQEMTKSGLRTIDYASGKSFRIENAVRTALMTGVNQIASKISDENAEKLGTEYFEVSAHGTARPSHQVWQGKVYKKDELESVCGLGKVDGLCGANCRHSYYPFISGISVRKYTDEQLEEWANKENTPKKYGDKEYTSYEASQEQRRLERLMRKQRQDIKLLKEGEASEEDIMTAEAKYRITSDEYVKFSKAMGLPQQRERVYSTKSDIEDKEYKADVNLIDNYKSVNQNYFIDENGKKYVVDGKNVVLKASKKEIDVADMLGDVYKTKVKLVPVVLNPPGVKTPDYILNEEKFDLKEIFGSNKNTLYNAITRKKAQSDNFIFDITQTVMSKEEAMEQIEGIYKSKHKGWVNKIILIKDNKILKEYKRK